MDHLIENELSNRVWTVDRCTIFHFPRTWCHTFCMSSDPAFQILFFWYLHTLTQLIHDLEEPGKTRIVYFSQAQCALLRFGTRADSSVIRRFIGLMIVIQCPEIIPSVIETEKHPNWTCWRAMRQIALLKLIARPATSSYSFFSAEAPITPEHCESSHPVSPWWEFIGCCSGMGLKGHISSLERETNLRLPIYMSQLPLIHQIMHLRGATSPSVKVLFADRNVERRVPISWNLLT